MAEESLSPLSKSILNILSQTAQEDKKVREELAVGEGLPEESSWNQIGVEAKKKIVLDLKSIVEGIRPINSELAVKLERCFLDGVTLMENMSATPEKIEGKLAAATFLHDFADLRGYSTDLLRPSVLKQKGISSSDKAQEAAHLIGGIVQNAWQFYEKYGELQNFHNRAGYPLGEDEALETIKA